MCISKDNEHDIGLRWLQNDNNVSNTTDSGNMFWLILVNSHPFSFKFSIKWVEID